MHEADYQCEILYCYMELYCIRSDDIFFYFYVPFGGVILFEQYWIQVHLNSSELSFHCTLIRVDENGFFHAGLYLLFV